jgi:hypothetical protein
MNSANISIFDVKETRHGFSWKAIVNTTEFSCTSDSEFVWPICGSRR